jgi:2-dehydro-3-deoxygluconokinase
MNKVVTFGEIMLRLNPGERKKFLQTMSFNSSYAGSEANVAVSLSSLGLESYFLTKMPENDLGKSAISTLRYYGVNVDKIKFASGRLGIYFVETGASQRPSQVIYDRKNSVFSNSCIADYNWEKIFEDIDWFHFSGITPALDEKLEAICLEACKVAKEKNLKVSCDINYRGKLWSREKASHVMKQFMPYIDILIANEEDAKVIFGYESDLNQSTNLNDETYVSIIKDIFKENNFEKIFFSMRESYSSSRNGWSGLAYDGETIYKSKKYEIDIVDRLGAGDSFAAGVIYCELKKFKTREQLEFSVASSCLKHSIQNDFNLSTEQDILALLNSDGNARINR